MLIPLPFYGQSSTECVEAVFAEPAVLAATERYPLGQNPSIYDPVAFQEFEAPMGIQEIWAAYRDPRYAKLFNASSARMLLSRVSLFPM